MIEFLEKNIKAIVFYVALFCFITVVGFQTNLADYDLFARLLQGQAFWKLGYILKQDIFSYTPTHIWYDHEWGSSVVFYAIQEKFGAIGLLWLKVVMTFSIFVFLIEALKVRGLKYTTPYNFLFFFFAYHAAAYSGYSSTIRCQMFTYLFFAIWMYLLERIRAKKEYNWLWTFPLMMLLWANIHGGCMAGFGLLGLYTIGEALNKKPFKYYIFTLILCTAVIFINPWGFEYVKFLLMATTMPRPLIGEWQSTFGSVNIGNFMFFKTFFVVMISFVIARLYEKRKSFLNLDFTKAIILLTMTVLCLRYTRHQPFFVFSCIVFLYDDFYFIFNKITGKIFKVSKKLVNIKELIIYSFVVVATISYFTLNKPEISVGKRYPHKAIEFIRINEISGNLLVDFHHGSYAAYKLFPMCRIAMDGRYEEVYNDYMIPLFNNFFMQAGEKKNMLLEVFPPDIIISPKYYSADKAILQNSKYTKVYEDELFSVFVDKKLSKKEYKQPEADIQYYNEHLFETQVRFKVLR